jgi:alkylated DNA repair protein (DNA oxidative demethylase)
MSIFAGYEATIAVLKTTDEDWAWVMLAPERLYHARHRRYRLDVDGAWLRLSASARFIAHDDFMTGCSMYDLFEFIAPPEPRKEIMAQGAVLLRGAAFPVETELLAALNDITATSPFRHMVTPGGYTMSVAMSNCGAAGWVTDRTGYRYDRIDPTTGNPWPPMPDCFLDLAVSAAITAGYPEFRPDACLINRYEPGARLSLHQDKNERNFAHPIVSVSLGLPAIFQFGGLKRNDPVKTFALRHGDVAVWGGPSRLCYHGISGLKEGYHATVGRSRINLTFRGAL